MNLGTLCSLLTEETYFIAYIPLRAKYLASGVGVGQCPDARILRWGYQHVGILEPTQTLKLALPPTPTPHASQWNIGGVGSSGVGHLYFMYISCIFLVLCTTFSALATRTLADANPVSSGIWAYNVISKGVPLVEEDI